MAIDGRPRAAHCLQPSSHSRIACETRVIHIHSAGRSRYAKYFIDTRAIVSVFLDFYIGIAQETLEPPPLNIRKAEFIC